MPDLAAAADVTQYATVLSFRRGMTAPVAEPSSAQLEDAEWLEMLNNHRLLARAMAFKRRASPEEDCSPPDVVEDTGDRMLAAAEAAVAAVDSESAHEQRVDPPAQRVLGRAAAFRRRTEPTHPPRERLDAADAAVLAFDSETAAEATVAASDPATAQDTELAPPGRRVLGRAFAFCRRASAPADIHEPSSSASNGGSDTDEPPAGPRILGRALAFKRR